MGGGVAASRASAKSGPAYENSGRDLVDSKREDKEVLRRVKAEELPEKMKAMTPQEREKFVDEMAGKRAEIQKQIAKLSKEREDYLANERKRLADEKGEATLGDAVVTAIQKQLADSGFEQ